MCCSFPFTPTRLLRFRTFSDSQTSGAKGLAKDSTSIFPCPDTFEGDPISHFRLSAPDYLRMGEELARLRKPTLFTFEGGYSLDALAEITVNVFEGFEIA